MKRHHTGLAELALPDCQQSLGEVDVGISKPNRFATAHAGRGQQSDQTVIRMATKSTR